MWFYRSFIFFKSLKKFKNDKAKYTPPLKINYLIKFLLRKEMKWQIYYFKIKNISVESILDIGTTDDNDMESSNYLLKKLKTKENYFISDQKINDPIFDLKVQKSLHRF